MQYSHCGDAKVEFGELGCRDKPFIRAPMPYSDRLHQQLPTSIIVLTTIPNPNAFCIRRCRTPVCPNSYYIQGLAGSHTGFGVEGFRVWGIYVGSRQVKARM